jgi:Cft2 family RNA processing exonuclease
MSEAALLCMLRLPMSSPAVAKLTRCDVLYAIVMLTQVHQAVTSGGKVLIPVFAVGRAQELLLLLDEFWERTQLQVGCWAS